MPELELRKYNIDGLEPGIPHEEGEVIQTIDFGRIDPKSNQRYSIICLGLHLKDESVIKNLKIYSPPVETIPEGVKIRYSSSGTWITSPNYNTILVSSSEIPISTPLDPNLMHISGSNILSGSSFSGSSQYMHLTLSIPEDYPFGIYNSENINLYIDYDDIT